MLRSAQCLGRKRSRWLDALSGVVFFLDRTDWPVLLGLLFGEGRRGGQSPARWSGSDDGSLSGLKESIFAGRNAETREKANGEAFNPEEFDNSQAHAQKVATAANPEQR